MVAESVVGEPILIILEFTFHCVKVEVEAFFLGSFVAEVEFHARVVAFLELGLEVFLVVVEVGVKVG